MSKCTVKGCDKPIHGRGFCATHWARWKKHGSPDIVTTRQKGTGTIGKDGYTRIVVDGKHWLLHRLIYTQKVGPIPEGMQIHHLDGDKNNNDPKNLTLMTLRDHHYLHLKGRVWKKHSEGAKLKMSISAKNRPKRPKKVCSMEGCNDFTRSKGLCNRHYIRLRKFGDPLAYRGFIPLP